ncbi:MAG: DUF559 domain-containing protein [Pseudanabaena sp. SU_2_4]|nr:DUF559 domain-containing protein [Pseudanabaena sp. SU_2_4]
MKKGISKSSYDPNWQPSQTKSEIRIKKALENHGFIVRHNEKICGYYPDIHIANTSLLIEIDGAYHFTKKQRKRDAMRTKHLEQLGFKVLRFIDTPHSYASLATLVLLKLGDSWLNETT